MGFQPGESEASSTNLLVPVLVSSDPNVAEDPIIGFNAIEEVIKGRLKHKQGFKVSDCVADIISGAFDIDSCAANSFIQLIHMHQTASGGTIVKIGKNRCFTLWRSHHSKVSSTH